MGRGERRTRQSGVGIVAVVLIVAMLSSIGAVVALLVASGAVSKTNDLVREQAFGLIHAGFEYALKRMDDGFNPDGDMRNLGNGRFTISYQPNGTITVTANVSAMLGSAAPSFSIQGPPLRTMGSCLEINPAAANLANSNRTLQGIALRNGCTVPITIAVMVVSWDPAAGEGMTQIRIGGDVRYDNPSGISSGMPAPVQDTAVAPCSSTDLALDFNAGMLNKNFTILFRMSDSSSKSGFVQFVADNEAACLNVDTSAMAVGFTGYARLLNGALANSCSPPTSIRLDRMTVSWAPTAPARQISQISMGGTVVWNGPPVGSGTQVNLAVPRQIAGGGQMTQDYLNFNLDMRGYNYTIVYGMRDGTSKSVAVPLYSTDMEACLGVANSACSIGGGGNADVLGQEWLNTCPLRIVVDSVRSEWTSGKKLTDIVVNGTTVWPGGGGRSSGSTIDIMNVDIPGGANHPVTRYRFNSSMMGQRITSQTYALFPSGATFTVSSSCP